MVVPVGLLVASLVMYGCVDAHTDADTHEPGTAPSPKEEAARGAEASGPVEFTDLLTLTERMPLAGVSKTLAGMPRQVTLADGGKTQVIAAVKEPGAHLNQTAIALGPDGGAHCTYVTSRLVDEPDRLGNPRRWRTRLHYMRQTPQGWSKPEVLLDDLMAIGRHRLLIAADGTGHVLIGGHNAAARPNALGRAPGESDIVMLTRTPAGDWSPPRSVVTRHDRLRGAFDACLDDRGDIHLVRPMSDRGPSGRGSWRRSHLTCQVCRGGKWTPTRILARMPGRSLSRPRLRWHGGRLHVVAAGQTSGYRRIGSFAGVADDGSGALRLLADHTAFRSVVSTAPAARLVAGVLHYRHNDFTWPCAVLFELEARAGPRAINRAFAFADRTMECSSGWTAPGSALDVDAGGRPFLLNEQAGSVFLLRLTDAGRMEGLCLHAARDNQSRASGLRLFIRHGKLHAFWIVAENRRRQALHGYAGPIPKAGWHDADALLWRSRAGVGLSRSDWRVVLDAVLERARQADRARDITRAVDRYAYVVANRHPAAAFDAVERAMLRLRSLDRAGISEVRRRLHRYAAAHREWFGRRAVGGWPPLRSLMHELKIDPARPPDAPAQGPATVRKLLDTWDLKPFDVPMPSGRVVRVRLERLFVEPPLAGLFHRRPMTEQRLRQRCLERIGQQPAKHIGRTRLFESSGAGDVPPQPVHTLDECADWQLLPAR